MQALVGVLGCVDAHYFHLVKLMQSVQSAHVFSIATGFAAEAGRVGAALDRQALLIENDVSEDVGYRYLGSRNQIQIV